MFQVFAFKILRDPFRVYKLELITLRCHTVCCVATASCLSVHNIEASWSDSWKTSKIISMLVRVSLFADPTRRTEILFQSFQPTNSANWCQRKHPQNIGRDRGRVWKKWLSVVQSSNISKTVQDRIKVTTEDQ